MEDSLRKLFAMMGSLSFSVDEMERARRLAEDHPKILSAITRLKELYQALEIYGVGKYVSYEPGMVSNYRYYTGIIFSGYTFGSGEPILKGGRYDRLLCHFGKNAPSIGFAVVVDQLMAVLSRQKIEVALPFRGEAVFYTKERVNDAVAAAVKIRGSGGSAELICMDGSHTRKEYEIYAKKNGHETAVFFE